MRKKEDAIDVIMEEAGAESENKKIKVTMYLDEPAPNFVSGYYIDDDGEEHLNVTLNICSD